MEHPTGVSIWASGDNQTQTFWFDAHYLQTEENVTAGKADAMATFNLIYN